MIKYPRTPHLEGSRFQPGDEDLASVPLQILQGRHVVVEEKLDGANAGISFDSRGALRLQSRGHWLTGGTRERQFDLFKAWAARHQAVLWNRLGDRYLVFGEWMYAHHTIFYDRLPHYFLEFDVLDSERNVFLSTAARRELLDDLPIVSVPVLSAETCGDPRSIPELVALALYKSERWREVLKTHVTRLGLDPERVLRETDLEDLAEGLYVKIEEHGQVVERFKWIRRSFLTAVLESGSHWANRPIVPNLLADGADLYGDIS